MDGVKKVALGGFFLLLLGCLTLFYVTTLPEEVTPHQAKIAVSTTPLSAPFYIAREKGYFKTAGIELEFVEKAGGAACFESLMQGEVDFATSSNSVVMFQSFQKKPFHILSSFVQSDNDIKILSRQKQRILQPQDLTGLKIGVVAGSASDYFLYSLLAVNGIEPSAVSTVSMKPNELPAALNAGELDAISIWEPYAYQGFAANPEGINILQSKGLYSLSFNLLGKPSDSPLTIETEKRIIQALQKAVRFIVQNPDEAQKITAGQLQLNEEQVRWAWQDYNFKLSLNNALLATVESQARWAVQTGMVPHKGVPDFRTLINSRALLSLDPAASRL